MPCSNLSYKGHYTVTATGFVTDHTITAWSTRANRGCRTLQSRWQGRHHWSQTRSVKGGIFNETFTGTSAAFVSSFCYFPSMTRKHPQLKRKEN